MRMIAGKATPMHASTMWKPSVKAIWLRAASRSAASGKSSGPTFDPPGARERLAGLQLDECLSCPEGIRRAGHRIDRQAAAGDIREWVAGEEHQVTVGLIHPERQPAAVVGIAERDASQAVFVALEIHERVVESRRADRSRPAEVELRPLDGLRADGYAPLVRRQDRSCRCAQKDRVDGRGPEPQVRMVAASIRTGPCAYIRGRRC